ncbi:heme NO-binding domain-containing protein [Woodsholea maritima]|uniref:heme NO-binding domain-containing protein n=1 Tax=Woodsholea maritima TaxID=240237 RepID=UPI0003721C8D|nr:heme NO-binding domain-containing protein [Woodsholea maritima]
MYGMIHKAVEAMVLENLGPDAWSTILHKSGLNDEHFFSAQSYDDKDTFALIGTVQAHTGMTLEVLLENFGQYWIKFAAEGNFSSLMDMAGDDLESFIQSLDAMHAAIRSTMPDADMPSFEVSRAAEDTLVVIYRSSRAGLDHFVVGLLQGLMARFNETGEVSVSPQADHSIFTLKLKRQSNR